MLNATCSLPACIKIMMFGTTLLLLATALGDGHGQPPPYVGTTIYGARDLTRAWWTRQDAVRLSGRRIVDELLPRRVPDGAPFLRYWRLAMDKSANIENAEFRRQTVLMVADALGGYLHGVLLPNVKAAYYDGRVDYDVTDRLHALLRKIKFVLGTDGRGWLSRTTVMRPAEAKKVTAFWKDDNNDGQADFFEDPCNALIMPAGSDSARTVVPLPAFDNDARPGSMVVPFAKGRRLFSMSDGRTPPLERYYRLAVGCAADAPHRFRRDAHRWLNVTVGPLLAHRRRWYPALAGAALVVRAAAAAAATGHRPKRRTIDSEADSYGGNTNDDSVR